MTSSNRSLPSPVVRTLLESGTASVADALGPVAGIQQVMAAAMMRRTTRQTIAGPAVTDATASGENLSVHMALKDARPGDVLVVAAGPGPGAQWGDVVSIAAQQRGMIGVVVDGPVHDIDGIEAIGFPVWSTSISPLSARKRVAGSINQGIVCVGVAVQPADIIVANGDGVVVIHREQLADVMRLLAGAQSLERQLRLAAAAGTLPNDAIGDLPRIASTD